MKVETLTIERKPSYASEYAGMLVGLVRIQGEHGSLEVKLSNKAVSDIFALVREDVQRVADYNASQAGQAISNAENELPLLENEGV